MEANLTKPVKLGIGCQKTFEKNVIPMRKILVILPLVVFLGCSKEKVSQLEQIKTFYEGFKISSYNKIRNTIADSLTITEGDYTMHFTQESYYNQFKWDSVFKPTYNLISIENKKNEFIAKVSVNSLRFKFLKNNPLTCTHKFYFKSGKISKIENLDCDANWEIWQKKRDSLVSWTKSNHPNLDGFINNLSMKGALDYLNAIKLYKENQYELKE